MNYLTVPLNISHNRKDFDCGKPSLTQYLQTQAKQDIKKKLSVCFILADEKNYIQGYYTLSSAGIDRNLLPEDIKHKLPPSYVNLPATLLGRLAVDKNHHGKGLGEKLLLDALWRAYENSITSIGSMAVIVDPLDEEAERFYQKYDFIKLPDSGKMFIAMATLNQLFNDKY
jgi:GNAT superfamily N-acetyltransferase